MNIGDIVYFVTDEMQTPYIITGYQVRKNGIIWLISHNGNEVIAYEFELVTEKIIF